MPIRMNATDGVMCLRMPCRYVYSPMDCTFVPMHWTRQMVVRYRRGLGLTQSEFAERLGTTQAMISRVENGRTAIWPMLAKLLTCMATTEGAVEGSDLTTAPAPDESGTGAG